MDWEAVGAIAETLGAIGIVVTLIYLAIQVRQAKDATEAAKESTEAAKEATEANTRAYAASSTRAISWGFAEFNERIATNRDLSVLVQKGLSTTLEDFDEVEWMQFYALARSEAGRIQDAFLQSRLGFHDAEQTDQLLDFMRGCLEYPAWRLFWEEESRSSGMVRSFIDAVNRRNPKSIGMGSLDEVIEASTHTPT